MVWNLFGKKKKAKTIPMAQAATSMPPAGVSGDTEVPAISRMQARAQLGAQVPMRAGGASGLPETSASKQAAASDSRLDALTVMAAIDSAKQELSVREKAIERSARRNQPMDQSLSDDPVARKKHLIQAALTVHRLKQTALDGLSHSERAKLRDMAETALGIDPKKSK